MSDNRSLLGLFTRCSQALRQLHSTVRHASPQIAHQLANQYDRLHLWDHDVGLTSGSLDQRLQMNSGLFQCVAEMLKELDEQLIATESEDQLLTALEEVTDVMDGLFSLEPTLKSPPPLDSILSDPPQTPFAQKLESTSSNSTLLTVAEKKRFTSGKSDVDIVIFREHYFGKTLPQDKLDIFLHKLPTTLEENGIYARVIVSSYEYELATVLSIRALINRLVKSLNRVRYSDPERPLQLVGSHRGTSVAQAVASALIAEGLVVDTERPICGCTFLNAPRDLLPASHKSSIAATQGIPLQFVKDNDVLLIDSEFQRNAERYHIDLVYSQLEIEGALAMDDDEQLLSIIHHIARTTEAVVNNEGLGHSPLEPGNSLATRKEDAFAILNGYDTAILVNDCGPSWQQSQNSIIDIVRDCVDTVLSYRDDLDIQLSSSKQASFSVEESSQASRMLAASKHSTLEWRLSAQISRYLAHYIASPSSLLPDGTLRPCNLIVLTASAPEDEPNASFQAISRCLDQLRSRKALQLAILVQIVLLGEDRNAREYFTRFDNDSKGTLAQFAPTFHFPREYESHAEICKRILLGAISPRFATISLSALDANTARLMSADTMGDNTDISSEGGGIWSSAGHKRRTGSISSASTDYRSDIDPFLYQPNDPGDGIDPNTTDQFQSKPSDLSRNGDWGGMAFSQHRRAPSDTYSDVSFAHPSPPGNTKDFSRFKFSPLLYPDHAQTILNEIMDIGSVSIDEPHSRSQDQEMFTTPDSIARISGPRISFLSAPPTRPTSPDLYSVDKLHDPNFQPPGQAQNYPRSSSDPSRQLNKLVSSRDVLSTATASVDSRFQSRTRNRRSSISSAPNRDYLLELADPTRRVSNDSLEISSSKRTQEHPATFQCSLCPKRFTRAYNLRSHLRTHTDERPFVCSHCGKAFARQHDRKRHEGLHSGEKKFVCRGGLKYNGNWGCGRRFARVDALGRHFRSEAGRVCIKPLIEEEASERMNILNREARLSPIGMNPVPEQQQSQGLELPPVAPQVLFDPSIRTSIFPLPAALLQQYPTLSDIWDALQSGAGNSGDDLNDYSTFDAADDYEDNEKTYSGWISDVEY